MSNIKKVVILYRVIQDWRAPIFEKLAKDTTLDIEVWYGPDFKNTKVISTTKEYNFKKRKLLSLKLRINTKNGGAAMPLSFFLFFSLIKKNPDIVISEGASNLFNSIQGFVYCKLFRKKFIWWSLGKLLNRTFDSKRSKVDKLVKFIEKESNAIISYSSRGFEYFKSLGIPEEKIHIAVNVVDTDAIINNKLNKSDLWEKRRYYLNKYDFVVLFVGALTKEKSIDKLIKAQRIIEEEKYNRIGLVIVGDGNFKGELQKITKNIGVKRCEFVGRSVEDNYKYFAAGDIFVLPGLGGLAISEAMCYGLPIITSIGDGCEVDLVTTSNGIIDIELNEYRLANYIFDFYQNREKLKQFGEKSRNIISQGLNIENYLLKIKTAINQ